MTLRGTSPPSADARIELRVDAQEMETLKSKAEAEGLTVSGLLRKGVGLPVRGRGGVREGAGRPSKKAVKGMGRR